MAQKDSGEERNIPATPRRLRQLRRDGIVPRSRDFQSAIGLLAIVAYLLMSWRSILDRLEAGFLIVDPAMPGGFAAEYQRVASGIIRLGVEILGPVAAIAIFGTLLGAMIDGKGFPINTKALAPNFGKLSPGEGMKNLFSLKNLLDLVKGLLVIALVLGGNVLLFRAFYNDLMWSPSCGSGCVLKVFVYLIGGSILIGLIVVLAMAFLDLPLSRRLFLRDNKMTVSEFKRDMKEEEGDPQIRGHRRQQIRQAAETAGFVGVHRAQIVLAFGDAAVALTYIAGRTPAPVVAARTRTDGADMVLRAAELHLPVVEEPSLVAQILEGANIGDHVPNTTFDEVAKVLVQAGIIKVPGR